MADLLARLGPTAPTLCSGWAAHQLAAHLVARERRPDTAPGFVLNALARHSEKVLETYQDRSYDELVGLIRTGPPSWSPFGLPMVEPALNTAEFFVHHEDLRRAQTGWAPRRLDRSQQDELWQVLGVPARIAFRRAGCGVILQRSDIFATESPGATAVTAKSMRPVAVVTGEPQELLLFAYGRRAHALVDISGPVEATSQLANLPLAS